LLRITSINKLIDKIRENADENLDQLEEFLRVVERGTRAAKAKSGHEHVGSEAISTGSSGDTGQNNMPADSEKPVGNSQGEEENTTEESAASEESDHGERDSFGEFWDQVCDIMLAAGPACRAIKELQSQTEILRSTLAELAASPDSSEREGATSDSEESSHGESLGRGPAPG